MKSLVLALSVLFLTFTSAQEECPNMIDLAPSWEEGLDASLPIRIEQAVHAWTVVLNFDAEFTDFTCWVGEVSTTGSKHVEIKNYDWDGDLNVGDMLDLHFQIKFNGDGGRPQLTSATFNGQDVCGSTQSTSTTTTKFISTTTPGIITTSSPNTCQKIVTEESAGTGNWHGLIVLSPNEDVNGWTLELTFTGKVDFIESPLADVTGNGKTWILTSRSFDDEIPAGGTLEVRFIVDFSGSKPSISGAIFNGETLCSDENYTTPELITTSSPNSCDDIIFEESAGKGNWHGLIVLSPNEDVKGWTLELTFNDKVDFIESPLADVTGNGKTWLLTSRSFDDEIPAGGTLEVRFIVDYSGSKPSISEAIFNGEALCGDENPVTTPEPITTSSPNSCDEIVIEESSGAGNWHGLIVLSPNEDVHRWTLELTFNKKVDFIESPLADVTGNGKTWALTSRSFDNEIPAGGTLEVRFIVDYSGSKPSISEAIFNGEVLCGDENPVTTPEPITTSLPNSCDEIVIEESAGTENWHGLIVLSPNEDVNGWTLELTFTGKVDFIESPLADVTGNGKTWTLTSRSFDDEIPADGTLEVRFIVDFSGSKPVISEVIFNDATLCGDESSSLGPSTPTHPPPTTSTPGDCSGVVHVETQTTNSWTGSILLAPTQDIQEWTVLLNFDASILLISTPLADVTGQGATWTMASKEWDGGINAGDELTLMFEVDFLPAHRPHIISIQFNGDELCQSTFM